jgi:PAS domain S-box-containing protein
MLLASLTQEWRHNEETLRESEARYRALVTASSEIVWRANSRGEAFFLTSAWQELTGQTEEESRNGGWLDAVHPDDREKCKRLWDQATAQGHVYENEMRVLTLHEGYRYFYLHAVPIIARDGRVREWVGAATDITDRKHAENTLRESEARFRNMAEHAPVMIWVSDAQGNYTYVNLRWSEFTGAAPGRPPGCLWLEMVHPEERKLTETVYREAHRDKRGFRTEYHLRRRDGEYRWVIDSATPRFGAGGEFLGYIGSIIDIAERKRAEQALQASEERLARTEKFSLVMVTHSDLQGRWLKVPPTLCKLLGYSEEELLGRSFEEVTHPDDLEINRRERSRMIGGETKSFDLEKRYIRKDGGIVWVYLNVSVVTDEHGTPIHCLSYIRDITRRKHVQDALRESKEQLQLALEAGGMGVWDWDTRSNMLKWSSEHFAIMGIQPSDRTPTFETWANRVHPDDLADAMAALQKAIATRGYYRREYRIIVNGSQRWVTSRAAPIYDRKGECVRVMGVVVDTTVRKRAESRLKVQYEIARLLSESASFVAAAPMLIQTICDCFEWQYGELWQLDREANVLTYLEGFSAFADLARFASESRALTFESGVGLPGRVLETGAPAWITDIAEDSNFTRAALAKATGLKSAFGFPVCTHGQTAAVMALFSRGSREPDPEQLQIVETIGRQIAQFTERKQAEEALRNALAEVQRLKERAEADNVYLREELSETHRYGEIVGQSEGMKKVLRQVSQVAVTDMTVLVLGETGTGKELVARAIHAGSARRQRPLVKVNCSALPAELMESELFGHEKGAFTGAVSKRVGRFELADGGTIFLDEIGDLALGLQAKLLRVLQEGEFERLGSSKTVRVNVRVITATNRDLSEAMRREAFRSDLYYRLAVYPIQIPALRERKGDIGLLAQAFLKESSRRLGRPFEALPRRVLESLQRYDWPGNVRELQNVIERATVTSAGSILELPEEWRAEGHSEPSQPAAVDFNSSAAGFTLEELERAHIVEVLNQTRWRIEGVKGAAVVLGLHPSTLRSRMSKLGISRSEPVKV